MNNRVFISSTRIIAPGVTENECISNSLFNGRLENLMNFEEVCHNKKAEFAHLSVSKENPYYPNRSDLKVMRADVLGLTVCIRSLCAEQQFTEDELSQIPLHIANGASIDQLSDQFDKIFPILSNLKDLKDPTQKNQKIFKSIPPLLALKTLTNGAQSFASQYSQVRGGGTTFGLTSIGGFYALKEAYEAIKNGESEMAIVGSCYLAGPYSYLCNSNSVRDPQQWRESSTVTCILLESETSLKNRKKSAFAEIKDLEQITKTPSLNPPLDKLNISKIKESKDNIIYGGAFCQSDFEKDAKTIKNINANAFSFFPYWGNTGPSSLLLSIVFAYEKLKNNTSSFQCVDYDAYARNFSARVISNSI